MTDAEVAQMFKRYDIRPTPQRIGVYQYLYDHRTHPSADVIYEALSPSYPSFSRTTIYNSIKTLAEKGLIRAVRIEEDFVRYDADVREHGHFKCKKCGQVTDFDFEWNCVQIQLPEGYQVENQDAYFYGICDKCTRDNTVT